MTENWLSTEVPKQVFHECLFLITSYDVKSTYCLTLKIWNEPCPPRCPYYKAGSPGSLEELETQKFIMSCRKFTRRLVLRKKALPYCKQYFMSEPNCQQCDYLHKYGF
ncbi:MAG: hypothetical protein JSW11_20020 [Candidatus Heimdallarchaeota archaeon]|nr:MAG: hypothetical protein JSW11_20020 [Candidatus Heimdallarchaeota archaeon]